LAKASIEWRNATTLIAFGFLMANEYVAVLTQISTVNKIHTLIHAPVFLYSRPVTCQLGFSYEFFVWLAGGAANQKNQRKDNQFVSKCHKAGRLTIREWKNQYRTLRKYFHYSVGPLVISAQSTLY